MQVDCIDNTFVGHVFRLFILPKVNQYSAGEIYTESYSHHFFSVFHFPRLKLQNVVSGQRFCLEDSWLKKSFWEQIVFAIENNRFLRLASFWQVVIQGGTPDGGTHRKRFGLAQLVLLQLQ